MAQLRVCARGCVWRWGGVDINISIMFICFVIFILVIFIMVIFILVIFIMVIVIYV